MTNISLPEKIFIYGAPVDMRCSFDGLFSLVHSKLEEDPASGSLFLFINRRGNYLKGLIWDRTGFMIIAKRLEHGRFRIRNKAQKVVIERSQLRKLLDGIAVGGFQIPRSGLPPKIRSMKNETFPPTINIERWRNQKR